MFSVNQMLGSSVESTEALFESHQLVLLTPPYLIDTQTAFFPNAQPMLVQQLAPAHSLPTTSQHYNYFTHQTNNLYNGQFPYPSYVFSSSLSNDQFAPATLPIFQTNIHHLTGITSQFFPVQPSPAASINQSSNHSVLTNNHSDFATGHLNNPAPIHSDLTIDQPLILDRNQPSQRNSSLAGGEVNRPAPSQTWTVASVIASLFNEDDESESSLCDVSQLHISLSDLSQEIRDNYSPGDYLVEGGCLDKSLEHLRFEHDDVLPILRGSLHNVHSLTTSRSQMAARLQDTADPGPATFPQSNLKCKADLVSQQLQVIKDLTHKKSKEMRAIQQAISDLSE